MSNLKIAVAQLEVYPGHPDKNTERIIKEIAEAKSNGIDIIVFSEMVVPGYLLGDEWENDAFIKDCFSFNENIKNATDGITAIWGNVDIDINQEAEDGRTRKFNAAFIAQNGAYVGSGKTHKTLMPKYREFDDERHFYSLRKEAQDKSIPLQEILKPIEVIVGNVPRNLGLILCEDMWSDDYTINPIDILLGNGADMIINLSCSPWTWRKNNKRHRVVQDRLKKKPAYFIYANNIGIQNNGKNIFLFDGNSTIYNPDGTLNCVAEDYTETTIHATLFEKTKNPSSLIPEVSDNRDREELYNGLLFGIRRFMQSFSNKKVVIGLSGGIDSALSAALLAKALGSENVYAINMPSQYNSNTTKNAAKQVATNLGIHYASISIQESYENSVKQFEAAEFTRLNASKEKTQITLSTLNKENIQARDRGSRILAGVASALEAIFVNNGNKTETTFGYATLYGDINGALAPIADLYKTEVYDLARYINTFDNCIPQTIFDIPASAELSDEQNVDEGKGDPILYTYHDQLVRAFVVFRLDPEDILRLYAQKNLGGTIHCDQELIDKYFPTSKDFITDLEHKWKLYKINYFKRIQAPPIITVSKRAFGFDLREAQNGVYFTREYLRLKKELLVNK